MLRRIIKNNIAFFTLCSFLWALLIFLVHGGYSYFERPARSTATVPVRTEFNKQGAILSATKELYISLLEKEEHSSEGAHIYQNIGTIYFDMYKVTGIQRVFDSTEHYFRKSIEAQPDNKRFQDNLVRLYEARRRFDGL